MFVASTKNLSCQEVCHQTNIQWKNTNFNSKQKQQ